jgi:hypothetical protein
VLGNLFGKKKPKQIEANASEVQYLGDLEGAGVDALRFEVGKILADFPQVRNAYFSRLKYVNEDKFRIALILDSTDSSHELGREIAQACAGISPMDITFLQTCNNGAVYSVIERNKPLFSDSNSLFECPIVVSRGTNEHMPKEWKGALLTYFVAEKDYESALLKAANDLKLDGYKFENVYDGKVNQLDPKKWWSEYVMEKWNEYSDHFPSQGDIEIMVKTGGIYKGPALGWETEAGST